MEKTKVKVIGATVGKYDVDSITVELNGEKTEICFDKKDEVTKYVGKEVYLSSNNGIFFISPVEPKK